MDPSGYIFLSFSETLPISDVPKKRSQLHSKFNSARSIKDSLYRDSQMKLAGDEIDWFEKCVAHYENMNGPIQQVRPVQPVQPNK